MYTFTMTTRKRKPGRPAVPPTKRRSSVVIVRITDREFKKVLARAEASDMTVSTYVAQLIKQDLER